MPAKRTGRAVSPQPELERAALTYAEQGATRAGLPGSPGDGSAELPGSPGDGPTELPGSPGDALTELPAGYHHTRAQRVIGHGPECFHRAVEALLSFQMHRRAGLAVTATAASAAPGVVVLLRIGLGRLSVTAPCRVVYVIDESTRQGFGYGTLPGHQESGEEAFAVQLEPDASVRFTAVAFWRPATALSRLGGPLTRLAQHVGTRRYLTALASLSSTVDP